MRTHKTRPAGIAMLGLGLLATLFLLASPAGAGDSLGPNANNGSVTSGEAQADWGSTASGAGIAVGGSTASGCSIAANGSTASGGVCAPEEEVVVEEHKAQKVREVHEAAEVAHATQARRLALTGTSSGPLAAGAALLLIAGAAMVVLTSDRRRALQHS